MQTAFLPLTPDDALDVFRIDGTMAVRALVRELIATRSLVTLYAGDNVGPYVVSRVLSLEADTIEFDFDFPEAQRQPLLAAPILTVVGAPGSVKIQFAVTDFEVSDPAGGAVLTAPIPAVGWRVQRRNAFRVRPPEVDQAVVVVRRGAGKELATRLDDLSAGGLALLWPAGEPVPELGLTLRHCRIEAEHIDPIPCDLRLIRAPATPDGQPVRISAEFYAMPQAVSRHVQMYVVDVEKRERSDSQRSAVNATGAASAARSDRPNRP